MKEVEGNLISMGFDGDFDVIIQGANCFCTMGHGIAKEIRERCPGAYRADQATKRGDKDKLGTLTYSGMPTNDSEPNKLVVVNAYTQFKYGGRIRHVDYDALRSCFKETKKLFSGKRIGYPLIGAGLARGDWKVISAIIDEELEGEDHTLVRYKP